MKEIRKLDLQFRTEENEDNKMEIKGYAVVFNSPETYGYTEVIDSKALDNADRIFNFTRRQSSAN